MARGSEGKSARKQARKEARSNKEERAKEAERILSGEASFTPTETLGREEPEEESSSEEEDSSSEEEEAPEKTPEKKKKSKSARARKAAASRSARGGGTDACGCPVPGGGGSREGIKTMPLVLLVMLTGTTLVPALLWLGDNFSAMIQKHHLLGSVGARLGIGPSPRKRVVSFYEKHDPEKLLEVNNILAKYYGDYPKLVKRLERKYGDYGYFLNWEADEAPMTLALEKVKETRDALQKQFDRHAPAVVKTGARNVRHNLGYLYRKGHRLWKKTVWPVLQPHLGTPTAKEARKQKLKDKKEYERAKRERTGQRRKSAEFRDDEGDEM